MEENRLINIYLNGYRSNGGVTCLEWLEARERVIKEKLIEKIPKRWENGR